MIDAVASWLQGGPFLEVSFLMELTEQKTEAIQDIIKKLSILPYSIEYVDDNLDELIELFDQGYPYDDEDPQTIYRHSLFLRLYVTLSKKRKATLQIEVVSSNTILVDFWFFGSIFDAWGQPGINKVEIADFTKFLQALYSGFEFKVGAVAIEDDVRQLFGLDEICPNECYRYENLSANQILQASAGFIDIIWNEKYKKLSDVPYPHKRLDQDGILISVGSFDD